jgi:hypothetical protein
MGDSVPMVAPIGVAFQLGDSQLANQSTTATAQSPSSRDVAGSDPYNMVESRIAQKAAQLRRCPQANVETLRPPEVLRASTCAAPKGRVNTAYHRAGKNVYPPLLGPPQLPSHATPTRRASHAPSIPVVCSRGLDPELGSPTPKASKRPGSELEGPTPKVQSRDEPSAPTTGERLPGVADPWDNLRCANFFLRYPK